MLPEERVRELNEALAPLTQFADKQLVKRPEWGTINFEKASEDIDTVISIANDLLDLPVKFLTEHNAQELLNRFPPVVQSLKQIDEFSLETAGQPSNVRDAYCNELHSHAEQLQEAAYRSLPYLAYRHGDIAENRQRVAEIAREAERTLSQARQTAATQEEEIRGIVRKAQDAAASVGVATFTAEFDGEAGQLKKRSRWWLGFAAGLGVLTAGAAIGFYFWPKVPDNPNVWETIRNVASKAAVLAILFTSAVWCGRIYRALIHQATVNKHRALSLKTFQAFVKAAGTDEVRDAVLLATTNAAFGNVPTGLVEHSAGEGPTFTVTEMSKKAASRAMRTGAEASD